MDASVLIAGTYFVLKALAYCTWCWVGVRMFRPEREAKLGLGIGFGLFRMSLGLVFGVGIFLGGAVVYGGFESAELSTSVAMALTYLAVYVPVRWIEWAIVETILVTGEKTFTTFLGGSSARGVRWRLGGIAISCLADVPLMVAAGGIPIGRFMC